MTYGIVWEETAVYAAARHLDDDPAGLRQLLFAVELLSGEPRPQGAAVLGSGLRRIHVGRYRVVYTLARDPGAVVILHVGRLG
ncbi:type II toxin-antitoxin system RelE family toxin [Streptomyces sp. NRRL F-2664]|uniref:type II toxin-antitoxin system RelE family toxin n=1 Tax=Streptomyces sp. NRRL F-2664 TaxID=1463842 RepID=UPI0004C678F1|nr:type II toxin-antitoxin system RelE/ParE family toxin [Streptomyces sp. NRRL F-2664]